jgi:hypothetical protein
MMDFEDSGRGAPRTGDTIHACRDAPGRKPTAEQRPGGQGKVYRIQGRMRYVHEECAIRGSGTGFSSITQRRKETPDDEPLRRRGTTGRLSHL